MSVLAFRTVRLAAVALAVFAVTAAPAAAAGLAGAHVVVPVASIWSTIGSALLGAFTWTVGLASKFILVTLGALIRMLIPKSWAQAPINLFEWIVAIPNYAGTVASPGGGTTYGFAGVNAIRELFEWIGIGLLPLSLTYATGRNLIGAGDHLAAPIVRVLALAAGLLSYTYWWAQAGAVVNQVTNLILSPAPVVGGIRQLMAYAVEGVALGGWQLIDLGLMAALGLELLALIVVKVVIILLGAILFATGPVLIGLVPTEDGAVAARAWLSAVGALLLLQVAWATIFAVGAVLIGDASTAGPLIGGNSTVGQLLGGVLVAVAGAATLWLCLRASREFAGILRGQLSGLLTLAGNRRSARTGVTAPTGGAASRIRAAQSVRSYQRQVRHAPAVDAARTGGPRRSAGSDPARGLAGRATLAGAALRSRVQGGAPRRHAPADQAPAAGRGTAGGGAGRRATAAPGSPDTTRSDRRQVSSTAPAAAARGRVRDRVAQRLGAGDFNCPPAGDPNAAGTGRRPLSKARTPRPTTPTSGAGANPGPRRAESSSPPSAGRQSATRPSTPRPSSSSPRPAAPAPHRTAAVPAGEGGASGPVTGQPTPGARPPARAAGSGKQGSAEAPSSSRPATPKPQDPAPSGSRRRPDRPARPTSPNRSERE